MSEPSAPLPDLRIACSCRGPFHDPACLEMSPERVARLRREGLRLVDRWEHEDPRDIILGPFKSALAETAPK